MGAAAPKPPLAIPPHSKLWGFLAFSRELEVSAVGMGCWAIGGSWTWAQPGENPYPAGWGKTDDKESIRAIHAGLDAGINFFRHRRQLRYRPQ